MKRPLSGALSGPYPASSCTRRLSSITAVATAPLRWHKPPGLPSFRSLSGAMVRPAARQRTGRPGTAAGGGIYLFQSQRRTLHDKAGPFNDDPFLGFCDVGSCCNFLVIVAFMTC